MLGAMKVGKEIGIDHKTAESLCGEFTKDSQIPHREWRYRHSRFPLPLATKRTRGDGALPPLRSLRCHTKAHFTSTIESQPLKSCPSIVRPVRQAWVMPSGRFRL